MLAAPEALALLFIFDVVEARLCEILVVLYTSTVHADYGEFVKLNIFLLPCLKIQVLVRRSGK